MSTVQEGDNILPTVTTQQTRYGTLVMGKDDNDIARFIYINPDGSINSNIVIEEAINLKNVAGTTINPATVEKQNDIISALGGSVDYDILLDETSTANITYVGKAAIGTATSTSVWQIKRLNETSGDLEIGYADSNSNFDNIWDDRTSLTYSK